MRLLPAAFGNRIRNAVTAFKSAVPRTFSQFEGSSWVTLFDSEHNDPLHWQKDIHISRERAEAHWAVWGCQTLIAADIGKVRPILQQYDAAMKIYREVESPAVSPFLRKPNEYQTWPEFAEQWMLSKLSHGNAYILKETDGRSVAVSGYVLDPTRVMPLISESGAVFYRLGRNPLAKVDAGDVVVPADQIIHDRMSCLFHPLIGVSPLYAAQLPAAQGLDIQTNATRFFRNASVPSGILVSAQRIDDKLAESYQTRWETRYGGKQRGRVAVLGNGLEYKTVTQNAVDSQLVEQLKLTAEMVCTAYHVPPYKIGVGSMPSNASAELLNQIYYSDCIQSLMKKMEEALGVGLALNQKGFRIQLDEDDLLRMDKTAQIEFIARGVEKAVFAPNEARARFNLPPVTGGDSPMLQQQNFSLEALAKRDSLPNPFVIDRPTTNPTPSPQGPAAVADPKKEPTKANAYQAAKRLRLVLNKEAA